MYIGIIKEIPTGKADSEPDASVIMLANDKGIRISILTRGASILEIRTPDRFGLFKNIAMSLFPYSQYGRGGSCAGATLGPNAGRIRGGELCIESDTHILTQNDGRNQNHGGFDNFSFALWRIVSFEKEDDTVSLTLGHTAVDGREGYPGKRTVTVTYTLDNSNCLTIHYSGLSDKPTWLNLSNHTYWNLTGDFTAPVTGHMLEIASDEVLYNDQEHLPIGLHPVDGSPFDFRTPRIIQNQLDTYPDHPQIRLARGYNNAYSLSGHSSVLKTAAVLSDAQSGRRITISTDYPSLVFYSGGFLDQDTLLAGGVTASPSCAAAFEAQEFPDALHLPGVPHPILYPGEKWERMISYAFDLIN